MASPSFGPLSPEDIKALVAAPFGAATKAIRKHDPMWGRPEGKATWNVTFSREVEQFGSATVEASSLEEAKKLAKDIPENEIEWDDRDYEIVPAGGPTIHEIEVAD